MFTKLENQHEIDAAASIEPEWTFIIDDCEPGEGGVVEVEATGVCRQTVKNRLQRAAEYRGREVAFKRSGKNEVVFQVS